MNFNGPDGAKALIIVKAVALSVAVILITAFVCCCYKVIKKFRSPHGNRVQIFVDEASEAQDNIYSGRTFVEDGDEKRS